MSYKEALSELRQQLFDFSQPKAEVEKPRGFILPSQTEKPKLEEAKINPYLDWLRTINQAVQEISSTAQETASSSFSKGMAKTVKVKEKSPDPVEAIPEERREAFIKRRGDHPSYYTPRPSKADTFKDLIDIHEGAGNYDTLYSHAQKDGKAFSGVKISSMTIGQLKQFANGEYGEWSKKQLGYKATPMGRYQFVGTTMAATASEMGLPDDTVFSPEVQDAMFEHLLSKTIARGKTVDEKVTALRGVWEGFKNVDRATLANLITKYGN